MLESEPKNRTPFTVVSLTQSISGHDYEVKRIQAISELLEGFDDTAVSIEVVAAVVSHTINGMIDHGASALGLDMDSTFGRIHASGHLAAAMGVGVSILVEVAPRTDDSTWDSWIREEFPVAVSQIWGVESLPAQLAQEQMQT